MAVEDAVFEVLKYVLPMRRSRRVRQLQRRLLSLNHMEGGKVDGLFGPVTRRAVKRFQEFAEIAATGVVDGETAAALGVSSLTYSVRRRTGRPRPVRAPVWTKPLPAASPERVILHWTAGGARASQLDRKHYHFLVEQDGTVVQGIHGVDANDRPRKGRYAAHTLNRNTRSVGVALCGMAGARERPFRAGKAPFTKSQLNVLMRLVAQICDHYGIPVTRKTVLGHGEVQDLLGVQQRQKWDPMVLPWNPHLKPREVGDRMRSMVRAELERTTEEPDDEGVLAGAGALDLEICGKAIAGGALEYDCATWARVGQLCSILGWTLDAGDEDADDVRIEVDGEEFFLPVKALEVALDGTTDKFVKLDDLVEELNLAPLLAGDGSAVTLSGKVGGFTQTGTGKKVRHVTIRRGDTLVAIARRELGDGNLWRKFMTLSGTPFDEAAARTIRAGDVIVIGEDLLATAAPPKPADLDADRAALFGEAAGEASHRLNREAARKAGELIARACFEHGVTDLSQIAYIFATAHHETNFGRQMREIWTNSARQQKYEANPSNFKVSGAGKRYMGRGYVQLTFLENYRKFSKHLGIDLEADPEKAADPEIASRVLVLGMDRVGYRSPKLVLKKFGTDGNFDFVGARQIINADMNRHSKYYGTTLGKAIGAQGEKFRDAFDAAGL